MAASPNIDQPPQSPQPVWKLVVDLGEPARQVEIAFRDKARLDVQHIQLRFQPKLSKYRLFEFTNEGGELLAQQIAYLRSAALD